MAPGITIKDRLRDMRSSTILFHLARHLLYNKYRDPGEEPKLHLFGQLKRITRRWLDGGYLKCSGCTYPAQVLHQQLTDMAGNPCRMGALIISRYARDGRIGPMWLNGLELVKACKPDECLIPLTE